MCACVCTQLCWTLYKLMDCNPPGSSVRGISQTRILEWVAISSFRGSSPPKERTHVSCICCIGRWVLYLQSHREAPGVEECLALNDAIYHHHLPPKAGIHNPGEAEIGQHRGWSSDSGIRLPGFRQRAHQDLALHTQLPYL